MSSSHRRVCLWFSLQDARLLYTVVRCTLRQDEAISGRRGCGDFTMRCRVHESCWHCISSGLDRRSAKCCSASHRSGSPIISDYNNCANLDFVKRIFEVIAAGDIWRLRL